MIKHGKAPYLECSSQGDNRFSAFYARPKSLRGRSIEQAYQGMKQFLTADGVVSGLGWKDAKGKHPINALECRQAYEQWWREWVAEQNLLPVLLEASGLSDKFGRSGSVCQATVLWKIRREGLL